MKKLLLIIAVSAVCLCSCSVHHKTVTRGRTTVVTVLNDTTIIDHGTQLQLPKVKF